MERDPQTYAIIGAAMEVHRVLSHGFFEAVYQQALAIEFGIREIAFEEQPLIRLAYKDRLLRKEYSPDFICFGEIVVELKALSELTSVDEAQLLNYLKATGFPRGLLLNFGAPALEHKRRVFDYAEPVLKA